MIGFSDEIRKRYRVRLEEGGLRSDPYAYFIPGRNGDIYIHGPDVLGISTHNSRGVSIAVRRLPFVTVAQDGSDGINATFPADRFKIVARLAKSRRRRQVTPEQAEIMAERLRKWGASTRQNRSDAENGQSTTPPV